MPHLDSTTSEPALRNPSSTTAVQHRAFIELSRVLASGEAAVMSSALPILVQGAGVPSAAIYTPAHDGLAFVAADSVPLKLRALLGEPGLLGSREFLAQRAFKLRRTVMSADVFGPGPSEAALAALEEAGWQCGIAVPILAGGKCGGVVLCGVRSGMAQSATVTFLEAMASVLGTAAFRPPVAASPEPSATGCPGCTASMAELLVSLGREVSGQHALLRDMCSRKGAPPEADALVSHGRALDRSFRRIAEVVLHLPASSCSHARRAASMASVVDVAVQAARPALTAGHVELEMVCAPACDFEGDPEMVAIALRHLLVNAAEAFDVATTERVSLPSGHRRVRVFVRNEGPALAVHVEDSGPGVPQDLRARVFEPSVTTKGPGRGLGLAVARHAIESLGGWLELGASELGGARASVFLPLRSAALEELRRAPTLQIPSRVAARRSLRPGV